MADTFTVEQVASLLVDNSQVDGDGNEWVILPSGQLHHRPTGHYGEWVRQITAVLLMEVTNER